MKNKPETEIDLWFAVGSTYTYLTVMRLPQIAREHNVQFNWRPFNVREVMRRIGNSPFIGKPAKANYMWRDIERRASRFGLSPKLPAEYPLENFDLANQLAVLASQQGWCAEYLRATYKAWFHEGLMAGSAANLEISLTAAGRNVAQTIVEAGSADIVRAYNQATEEACDLGIFGSPSFIVDGKELFWGDDRLEEAVKWAKR